MGTVGSKKVDDVVTEPRKAFSDDDIFRHSKRSLKSKQNYFNNQPLRPKSSKQKPQLSESNGKFARDLEINKAANLNSKNSFWNKKSKRDKSGNALADSQAELNEGDGKNNCNDRCRSEVESYETEPVIFRKLNKFQSDDVDNLWNGEHGEENIRREDDRTRSSVYRSYDCLNANPSLFQDPYLSKSFNPLVSSKLPFMLSYELKPSLVAQLNSFKTPLKDKLGVNITERNSTNPSGYSADPVSEYSRQLSVPNNTSQNHTTTTENDQMVEVDCRYKVDVSRYLIKPQTIKSSEGQGREQLYSANSDEAGNADSNQFSNHAKKYKSEWSQDDLSYKDLAKTLAKIVNKAGTHEYRKFCNLARAYSVDFSDVYIADFLESVETLAKLAKPIATPVATPVASPYRRGSTTAIKHGTSCEIPKTPRTNFSSQDSSRDRLTFSSKQTFNDSTLRIPDECRQISKINSLDRATTAAGKPLKNQEVGNLILTNSSANKRISRIPIPIGTKTVNKNHIDHFNNLATSAAARTSRNGYTLGHKQLFNNHTTTLTGTGGQKEALSSIDETQEVGGLTSRKRESEKEENKLKNSSLNSSSTTSSSRPPSKCCCFCEDSLNPIDRMDSDILGYREETKTEAVSASDTSSQFDVDFFYVDKDTKKATISFEEVLQLKQKKRMVQIQEAIPTRQSRPSSTVCRPHTDCLRLRRNPPVAICLLGDSSDRYVPVAKLTIRRRCTCEAQIRRLCSFLESSGCCLAEANILECNFEPSALLRFSKALELNESLRILNLDSCKLGDDSAMLLGTALKNNTTLTRLGLAKNSLGSRGVIYLTKGLAKNTTLQELNLDYNSTGDKGCEAIADILAGKKVERKSIDGDETHLSIVRSRASSDAGLPCTNSSSNGPSVKSWLRKVSLKTNGITHIGANKLFSVLRHCSSLTELELSGNQLDDESIEVLGNSLLFNRSLKVLKLDNCGLTWKSCEFLKRPLKTNTDLAVLSLDLNQLTDLGVSQLAEGLQYNRNLRELSLNMCSVTSVGLESLVSVIKSRTALRTLRLCYNDIAITENSNKAQSDTAFSESNTQLTKKDLNAKTSNALQALDQCLRESQKNLVDDFNWSSYDEEISQVNSTQFSALPNSRHQGMTKNSFHSSLYRKMIMALKRNPSLRIVMWGNQQTS